MSAKAFDVIGKSSPGMNECVYQSVTAQVSILLWWLAENETTHCLLM